MTRNQLEDYILGVILFDIRYFDIISEKINDSIFLQESRRIIYKNLCDILKDIDMDTYLKENYIEITLMNRLNMLDLLEKVGGIEEIIGLQAIELVEDRSWKLLKAIQLLLDFPKQQDFENVI